MIVVGLASSFLFAIKEPTPSEKQMRLGLSAYRKGDYRAALDFFMQVLIDDSDNKRARRFMEKSAKKLLEPEKERIRKEREEIMRKTRQHIRTHKMVNVDDIFRQANQNHQQGKYLLAYSDFQKAKEMSPRYEGVDDYLTNIRGKMKNIADSPALADAEKLAYARGFIAHYKEQNLRESINQWERVVALNPRNEEVRRFLDEAKKTLRKQERLAYEKELEERLKRLFNDGKERFSRKEYVPAIREWEKIIEIVEKEAEFSRKAEWRTKARNRIDDALEVLRGVLAPTPASRPAAAPATVPAPAAPEVVIDVKASDRYYSDGLIAYAQGRKRDAIRLWEHSLALNPGNERAKRSKEKAESELALEKR